MNTRIRCRVAAALLGEVVLSSVAFSQNVYHLDVSTTTGVDLTGYDSGSMIGPATADISFSGSLLGAAGTAASPFEYIGMGKQTTVTADNSGFHTLPLKLYNADGVTATSTLKFNANGNTTAKFCANELLDIGAHNLVTFGYGSCYGQATLSGRDIKVHDGGRLTTSYRMYFGCDKPIGISIVDGGSISVSQSIRIGWQNSATSSLSEPLTAFVGITNGTFSVGDIAYLQYNVDTSDYETANCRIVLGPNAVFSANQVRHHGGGRTDFTFDGGSFVSSSADLRTPLFYADGTGYGNTWPNPRIWLIGANGHPIEIEISADRELAGGKSSDQCMVYVSGNGGFTKRGAGTLFFNRKGKAVCDYTGPTAILGGGIVVSNDTFKVGCGDLSIAEGAFLDLNGFDAEFAGATGGGIVTNGAAATSTLTLGYGGADAAFSVAVGERINVVKTGAGTLTISGAALANGCNLTVEAGKVVFAGSSSTFGTVTVASGATLDTTGTRFSCANLVRMPGATILPPEATVMIVR